MTVTQTRKRTILLRRLLAAVATLLLLAALCFVALWKPAPVSEPVRVNIPHGSTFEAVIDSVERHHAASSIPLFRAIARCISYPEHIKSGSYVVTPDMGVLRLVFKLYRGNQDPVRLTIGNLRTVDRLAASIASQLELSYDTMLCILRSDSICAQYGFTPATIIALFPKNSYEVYWNIPPRQLLHRMQREYGNFWDDRRLSRCSAIHLTPVEVTTLASIVEEETNQDDEKENIASVYLNRLRRGIPLQADPTVKFAAGNFALRRVTTAVLRTESPYNTYLHQGLPPGPICIPGRASIDAVLANRQTDFLYFCAREDFSGHHRFAATLAEHNRNAARYHRALNARGIK
ncbi:MAG: UPF0755 protein [bacterium P3]|nr:MAG: UPF0755 protein [bacterium P3]KWW40670.1 MAG: UPF0755 protein [bacterium F083]